VSRDAEHLANRVSLGGLVEEPDGVHEVHGVVEEDVSVDLDEREREEDDEQPRADARAAPSHLPDLAHVAVEELALHVEEEPAVRELVVAQVAVAVAVPVPTHQIVQLCVHRLQCHSGLQKFNIIIVYYIY